MKKLIDKELLNDAKWLIPGLQIKRWFLLIFMGSLFITIGTMIFFNLRPV